MRRVHVWGAALALAFAGAGCGGQYANIPALDAVEKVRVGPQAREGAVLAPQAFALAERERELARAAHRNGDRVGATLHADRALAAYQHATVLARLARAVEDTSKADAARASAEAELARLVAAREGLDREALELDKRLTVAQESLVPAVSRATDAQREAARLVAARSLATQARLLCGAARLLSPQLEGLADAEREALELEKKLEATGAQGSKAGAIDSAARARVGCLAVLTKARRSADRASAGQADALLTELSAVGTWTPIRDERGVVVSLRGAFQGTSLSADGEAKLKELGRVLAAHPTVAAQVVLHDAVAPSAGEAAANQERASLAAKTLAGAQGAPRVEAQTAGARVPIADPNDPKLRARNARLDVVFVTPRD